MSVQSSFNHVRAWGALLMALCATLALASCGGDPIAASSLRASIDDPQTWLEGGPDWERDFGSVARGDTLRAQFEFRNRLDVAIAFDDVQSNCGCNDAEYDKAWVQPGDSLRIHLEGGSASRAGGRVYSVFHIIVTAETGERGYAGTVTLGCTVPKLGGCFAWPASIECEFDELDRGQITRQLNVLVAEPWGGLEDTKITIEFDGDTDEAGDAGASATIGEAIEYEPGVRMWPCTVVLRTDSLGPDSTLGQIVVTARSGSEQDQFLVPILGGPRPRVPQLFLGAVCPEAAIEITLPNALDKDCTGAWESDGPISITGGTSGSIVVVTQTDGVAMGDRLECRAWKSGCRGSSEVVLRGVIRSDQ